MEMDNVPLATVVVRGARPVTEQGNTAPIVVVQAHVVRAMVARIAHVAMAQDKSVVLIVMVQAIVFFVMGQERIITQVWDGRIVQRAVVQEIVVIVEELEKRNALDVMAMVDAMSAMAKELAICAMEIQYAVPAEATAIARHARIMMEYV
jgi:hypothetical protein